MAIMDESFRSGYQPFSRQTFAPLQQPYQFGNGFSSAPSSAKPTDTRPSMPMPNQSPQPGAAPSAPQGAQGGGVQPPQGPGAAGGYQSFAQMQAAGMARPPAPQLPAPGTPPGAPGSGPGGAVGPASQTTPVGNALQQAIMQALGNPSGFNSSQVQDAYKHLSQGIDDQYSQDTQHTNEELARRGLYDSTEAAGRLHDLNVGKKSAQENLAQTLLTQQAQDYGSSRLGAIAQALGLTGQENGYNLGQNQNLLSVLGLLGGQGSYGDLSSLFGGAGGTGAAGGGYGVAAPGAALPQMSAPTYQPPPPDWLQSFGLPVY